METTAKIQLSADELALVQNTEWILTRHLITKKVFEMFGSLNEVFKSEAEEFNYLFPENIKYQNGKISKGENYRLLPYVMLDYPAFFWKDRIFAIRTLFWWGNFFSVTLHLSGVHKEKYLRNGEAIFSYLQEKDFFVCINDDEWEHHFATENYLPASALSVADWETVIQKDFIKISKKIPLSKWSEANEFIIDCFREMMQLLKLSFPAGRTGL